MGPLLRTFWGVNFSTYYRIRDSEVFNTLSTTVLHLDTEWWVRSRKAHKHIGWGMLYDAVETHPNLPKFALINGLSSLPNDHRIHTLESFNLS